GRGRDGAFLCPVAEGFDFFGACCGQRDGAADGVEQVLGGQLVFLGVGGVEGGLHDGFDLGSGEAAGGGGDLIEVEVGGRAFSLVELDGEDLLAFALVG